MAKNIVFKLIWRMYLIKIATILFFNEVNYKMNIIILQNFMNNYNFFPFVINFIEKYYCSSINPLETNGNFSYRF